VLRTLQKWGRSPAAGAISLAERYPDGTMIVDELGTLTYSEVDTRTNALAHALSDNGIGEGDGVGVMCRNHRGFVEATLALSKLGADALYLNTAFAGPQLTEVVQREKPKALISSTRSSTASWRTRGTAASASWHGTTSRPAPTRRSTS
jgi:fatty-acyl-CoA synthase